MKYLKQTSLILIYTISLICHAYQGNSIETQLILAEQQADSGYYSNTIKILHGILPLINNSKPDQKLKAYLLLAKSHSYENSLEYGLKYYKMAYDLSSQLDDQETEGKSLLGIGSVYFVMDSLEQATKYFSKSLPILEQLNDTLNLAYISSNIGMLHSDRSEFGEASRNLIYALSKFELLKDTHGISSTYYNLGLNESKRDSLDLAIQYFHMYLNFSERSESAENVSKATRILAKEFYKTGQYEKSLELFLKYDSLEHDLYHQDSKEKILRLETEYKTAEIERDNALKQNRIIILSTAILLISLFSIITYIIMNQRRKRIKAASNQQIQDLLKEQEIMATYAMLDGQEKERKRIAAELHDNLGSILVTLNMYADTIQTKKTEEVTDLAKKISEVAQLANEETRKISHNLDSGMLKHFGLEAAIKQLSEAVSNARNIKFIHSIHIEKIPSDTGLEIYRIIQELVNNTLKHANCTVVHLELTQVEHSLSIIYEDNGIGFNKSEIIEGLGLKNIDNRVKKLDGELTIDSSYGRGSTFIIEIAQL